MYADVVFREEPGWSHRPGRRLALNFLPASRIVLGALVVIRLPVIEHSLPMTELLVRILVDDVERIAESPVVDATPQPVESRPESVGTNARLAPDPAVSEPTGSTDWYALVPEAARAAIDARPEDHSISPGLDERRRQAAQQFRPSKAPVERPPQELPFVAEIKSRRAGQARFGHRAVE